MVTEPLLLHVLKLRRYKLHVDKVDSLGPTSIDLNLTVQGRTLLHHAVIKNFVVATNLLLQAGWSEKRTDFLDKTPLDYANDNGLWDCLRVLAEQERQGTGHLFSTKTCRRYFRRDRFDPYQDISAKTTTNK
ncbi:MAG: hypothetical protein ACXV2C_07945, partial [Candidatus Bathyarchaeia archaeon]